MARSDGPKGKASGGKTGLLLAGVGLLLLGLALLGFGLAPLKQLWTAVGPVFSGGKPPDDLSDRMDASFAALQGRVVLDVLGGAGLLVGFILAKIGLTPPKPLSMEEMVKLEVEKRMAAMAAPSPTGLRPGATLAAPAASPTSVSPPIQAAAPQPVPAPAAVSRLRSCATCGRTLVAGGRICPSGHPQA